MVDPANLPAAYAAAMNLLTTLMEDQRSGKVLPAADVAKELKIEWLKDGTFRCRIMCGPDRDADVRAMVEYAKTLCP